MSHVMHHDGAILVNVNGGLSANTFGVLMQTSQIDGAIAAFLSQYQGDNAETISTIVAAAKAAAADKKGMQASLYAGFLQLAGNGATPAIIRAAGASIRQSVTRIMRVNAGFAAVKAKGAKETGAPDFSTASVYAGTVAGMLEAMRDNASAWDNAVAAVDSGETPLPVHEASGLFASVSAGKRALAKYAELCDAEIAHQFPALMYQDPSQVAARDVATLEAQNASLRQQVASMLAAGDVGQSLKTARAERDAAMSEALTLSERLRAAELEVQRLSEALAARADESVSA